MKGTLPGAALPPCRRPQRGSQSRGRPPPGTGSSPGLTPQDQPQGVTTAATDGNRQDDHRASPRSARPLRRSGTPKRRRTRPQRIKAGRDKGTTVEHAYRLDFGLFRYVRRDYSRDGMPPEAGSRHQNNVRNNAGGNPRPTVSTRAAEPGSRDSPSSAAVTGNRPASPEDTADQRNGVTSTTMKGTLPDAALPALSPTAALQSVPGTSAARRRIKPRTQPAGSAARRHPGSNPREPTRRSSGVATISPTATT